MGIFFLSSADLADSEGGLGRLEWLLGDWRLGVGIFFSSLIWEFSLNPLETRAQVATHAQVKLAMQWSCTSVSNRVCKIIRTCSMERKLYLEVTQHYEI